MIVIFIYLEYNQPTLRYIADEIDKKLEELLAIRGKCGKINSAYDSTFSYQSKYISGSKHGRLILNHNILSENESSKSLIDFMDMVFSLKKSSVLNQINPRFVTLQMR